MARGPQFWDRYFLDIAKLIASASKDPSTQTGAVIVRPDKTVASVGYNGFPRGIDDEPARYENRELKYELIVHCEMNAVLHAREPLHGCTLYTWPFLSCTRCCVHMIQAGIVRAVAPTIPQHLIGRWGDSLARTKALFAEAGVQVDEIDMVPA
jgi:dCMP deaminase